MWASPEGEAPWYLGTGRAFPAKTQEVDRKKKNIRVGLSDFPIFLAWTDFLFNSSIPKLEKFNQPEKHQNGPNRNQRNQRNLPNLRSFDDRKETSEASSPWSVTPTSRWGRLAQIFTKGKEGAFPQPQRRWQTDHSWYINKIHITYLIHHILLHITLQISSTYRHWGMPKPFHSR